METEATSGMRIGWLNATPSAFASEDGRNNRVSVSEWRRA